MNTQILELDLSKDGLGTDIVRVGQGDKGGTTIKAYIFDNGAEADLSGFDVYMNVLLPNKTNFYRAKATSVAGNVITSVIDESKLCSVPGYTDQAYFTLEKNGEKYSTDRFCIEIFRSVTHGHAPAKDWYDAFDEMVASGKEAASDANDAAERADESSQAASEITNIATTAEEGRATAEARRVSAESSRVIAEQSRLTAEEGRATAEAGRVSAESSRAIAESMREAKFAEMELRSKGWLRHYCIDGEYDAVTLMPTLTDVDDATIYFVPDPDADGENGWVEWIVDTSGNEPGWERMGTTNASVDYITVDDIEAVANDEAKTGGGLLNLTGLTALWARIKAKFAPKSHTHNASDITAGQLAEALIANGTITADMLAASAVTTAKIQDGAVTNDKLSQSVRDSLSQAAKLKPTTAQTQTLYWIHRSADKRIYIYSNADGTQAHLLGYIPLQGV